MSQLGIEHGPPAWESSTLEKSHPDSLLMAIQNIYIGACDKVDIFISKSMILYPETIL
jgi:hypothetical protein